MPRTLEKGCSWVNFLIRFDGFLVWSVYVDVLAWFAVVSPWCLVDFWCFAMFWLCCLIHETVC